MDPLSPFERKVLSSAERQFPRIADEVCREKRGVTCGITGGACGLWSCPKVLRAIA
jgi:hypothetical protein